MKQATLRQRRLVGGEIAGQFRAFRRKAHRTPTKAERKQLIAIGFSMARKKDPSIPAANPSLWAPLLTGLAAGTSGAVVANALKNPKRKNPLVMTVMGLNPVKKKTGLLATAKKPIGEGLLKGIAAMAVAPALKYVGGAMGMKANPAWAYKIGDVVKFSREFLKSTGQYAGDVPHATGTITTLSPDGAFATVDWDLLGSGRVNTRNLVLKSRLHLEQYNPCPGRRMNPIRTGAWGGWSMVKPGGFERVINNHRVTVEMTSEEAAPNLWMWTVLEFGGLGYSKKVRAHGMAETDEQARKKAMEAVHRLSIGKNPMTVDRPFPPVDDKRFEVFWMGGGGSTWHAGPFRGRAAAEEYVRQYKAGWRGDFVPHHMIMSYKQWAASGAPTEKPEWIRAWQKNPMGKGPYPFAVMEEKYRGYTMAQLHYAKLDAYKAAQAMQKIGDTQAEGYYMDDIGTIASEMRRRTATNPCPKRNTHLEGATCDCGRGTLSIVDRVGKVEWYRCGSCGTTFSTVASNPRRVGVSPRVRSSFSEPDCQYCGSGEMIYMGQLGSKHAYRCRRCGMDLVTDEPPANPLTKAEATFLHERGKEHLAWGLGYAKKGMPQTASYHYGYGGAAREIATRYSRNPRQRRKIEWILLRDGHQIFVAPREIDVMDRLHRIQSQSIDWAIKHEGYDIAKAVEGRIVATYSGKYGGRLFNNPLTRRETAQALRHSRGLLRQAYQPGVPRTHADFTMGEAHGVATMARAFGPKQARGYAGRTMLRAQGFGPKRYERNPMKLLTLADRKRLPPLGSQEAKGMDAVVQVKFFTPDSNWTWYATEFDGDDTFFGLVKGFESELGYFSLSELQSARGPMGLPVERDKFFKPTPLNQLERSNPKGKTSKKNPICGRCRKSFRSWQDYVAHRPACKAARLNPSRSKKVTMSLEQFARLVKKQNDPKLWANFIAKIKAYKKWTHGSLPKSVSVEAKDVPGVSGIWMTFDMGKTPETTYSMPGGAKRKGLWKHEWKSHPRLKGDPQAGLLITQLGGGNKVTDFLRG